MVGETIDEFTFLKKLGEGGMATVYRAEDRSFKDLVAIKVLKKEYAHHPNIRKRFIDEARKLHRINHPNVIKVRRIIDAGDLVAFVMDEVNGCTLDDYVKKCIILSDELIKKLWIQMIKTVKHVHEQGVIHRDIKPSNFMVDSSDNIRLLDFGIAKDTSASSDYTATGVSQQMGTPTYMSPEQIRSTKDVGIQSDIYSLGVVLWFMITKKDPYAAQKLSLFDLYEKIVNEPLPVTNSIWDNIIANATKKNISDRTNNCAVLFTITNEMDVNNTYNDPSNSDIENDKIKDFDNYKESFGFKPMSSLTSLVFGIWLIIKFGNNDEWGVSATVVGMISILYALYSWFMSKSEE